MQTSCKDHILQNISIYFFLTKLICHIHLLSRQCCASGIFKVFLSSLLCWYCLGSRKEDVQCNNTGFPTTVKPDAMSCHTWWSVLAPLLPVGVLCGLSAVLSVSNDAQHAGHAAKRGGGPKCMTSASGTSLRSRRFGLLHSGVSQGRRSTLTSMAWAVTV